MPLPGRSSASKRSSETASPKRMKRPPLQVPTATCPGSAMPRVYGCSRSGREAHVALGALGLVERLVGAPDELLGRVAVAGEEGDAEADREVVRKLAVGGDRRRDAGGDLRGLLRGGLGQQQRELVAADAEDR